MNTIELTARELTVYGLLLQARSDQEIAKELGISSKTAKYHVSNILRKTSCKTRFQLIARSKPDRSA